MATARKLYCIVRIFSLDPARVETNVRSVLAAAEKTFSSTAVKLHWNIPVHPFCAGADHTFDLLKTRVASDRDVFLPMGYGGGFPGYLSGEELSHEFSWSYKNPFKNSLHDLYGDNPVYVFPSAEDPGRIGFIDAGLDYAAGIIVHRDIAGNHAHGCLELKRESSVLHMKAMTVSDIEAGNTDASTNVISGKPVLSGSAHQDTLAYLLEIHGEPSREIIEHLLSPVGRTIDAQTDTDFGLLTEDSLIGSGPIETCGSPHFPGLLAAPSARYHRLKHLVGKKGSSAKSSTRESKRTQIRRALLNAGPQSITNEDLYPVDTLSNKSLHAEMPGNVVLPEEHFEAHFRSGRLTGFREKGSRRRLCREVDSYLSIDGRLYKPGRAGSFSFSSEFSRGLRESRSVSVEDGEFMAAVEYAFVEQCAALIVTVFISFPEISTGQKVSFAGCEIPVFSAKTKSDNPVYAAVTRGDGETLEIDIPPSTDPFVLTGVSYHFQLEDSGLTVKFFGNSGVDVTLPVRFNRRGNRMVFCLNPHGSYHSLAAESVSGVSERFSFAMAPSFTGEVKQIPENDYVKEEVLPDCVYSARNVTSPE